MREEFSRRMKFSTNCLQKCAEKTKSLVKQLYTVVGWSHLAFLRFSKSYKFLPIRYIFRRSIPKNRQISASARTSHALKHFHFQNITGALQIYMYFFNLQTPLLYIHQRTIAKN